MFTRKQSDISYGRTCAICHHWVLDNATHVCPEQPSRKYPLRFWTGLFWLVFLCLATALALIVFVIQTSAAEVQGDWTQDCHGTKVIVEQVGIAHFEVSCNGLQVEVVEVEDKPKAKPKQSQPELLMDIGYPAPPTVEPYPAPPTSNAPFVYEASPTKEPTPIGYEMWILGEKVKVYLKSPVEILDRMTKGVDNFYLVEYDGMELWGRPIN